MVVCGAVKLCEHLGSALALVVGWNGTVCFDLEHTHHHCRHRFCKANIQFRRICSHIWVSILDYEFVGVYHRTQSLCPLQCLCLEGISEISTPQAAKSASMRKCLSNKTMHIRPWPRIKGKNVILIDDVLTTGKTLEIATNHLKSAGVLSVQVAVLAVTEMPQKGKKKWIRGLHAVDGGGVWYTIFLLACFYSRRAFFTASWAYEKCSLKSEQLGKPRGCVQHFPHHDVGYVWISKFGYRVSQHRYPRTSSC